MTYELHGLRFSPPEAFKTDEVSVSLRAPPGVKDKRVLQKQRAIRPNMNIRRRILEDDNPGLPTLVTKLVLEVMEEVPGLAVGSLRTGPLVAERPQPGVMKYLHPPLQRR